MSQASLGRSDQQQQEQISPKMAKAFEQSPVV